MDKQYYFLTDNQQTGPMTLPELRQQPLTPDTFFWYEGLTEWRPGRDLPELSSLFRDEPSSSGTAPGYGAQPAANQSAYGTSYDYPPTLKPTPPAYEWYLIVWRKYAQFTGRARRSEYWYFTLFNILAMFAWIMVIAIIRIETLGILFALYILAAVLPTLAVRVRRMHDVGKSGWYIFIPFYNLLLSCTEGDLGPNRYGEDPKYDR